MSINIMFSRNIIQQSDNVYNMSTSVQVSDTANSNPLVTQDLAFDGHIFD